MERRQLELHYLDLLFYEGISLNQKSLIIKELSTIEQLIQEKDKLKQTQNWLISGLGNQAKNEWEWTRENQVKLLLFEDEAYPELLRSIKDPPILLFYKGDLNVLNRKNSLSVVGTRRATDYGKTFCHQLAKDLKDYEPRICSGLALGIDSEIHRACFDQSLDCIAVLPTGFDKIYPADNLALFHRLCQVGLVLSEYPHNQPTLAYKFVQRNRIIAGLSMACFVIESRQKGGSLITAEMAHNEHRNLYVLTGRYFDRNSQGCLRLLQQQIAKPFIDVDSFVQDLFWQKSPINHASSGKQIEAFDWFIDREVSSFQNLKSKSNLGDQELRVKLIELELNGWIRQDHRGNYRWINS